MSDSLSDLSNAEMKRLLLIAEKLTDSDFASSSSVRTSVLEDIMHLLRGNKSLSYVWNPQHNAYEDEVYINMGPSVMANFLEYWQFRDPITPLVRGRRKAVVVADVIPQKELVKTEFFNDVLLPADSYYGISGRAFDGETEIGDIGVWRGKTGPEFTKRDRLLLDIILPHFTNALRNVRRLVRTRGLESLWHSVLENLNLGLLLVERSGKLIFKNTVMLSLEKELLPGQYQLLEAHVCIAVARQMVISKYKGFSFSFFTATPPGYNDPVIVVIVSRTSSSVMTPAYLQAKFPLSRREAEVCAHIVKGSTDAEIADLLGVSVRTIHTYKERVFAKLVVFNRAELAGLLGSNLTSFNPVLTRPAKVLR